MIPTILSKLSGNVTEAADLMHKAAMHRDTCRDLATWCQEMATAHLGFNGSGRKILSRPWTPWETIPPPSASARRTPWYTVVHRGTTRYTFWYTFALTSE